MNENKNGKPFTFPDFFILVISHIRSCFHLPYRQTEGVIKATGKTLPSHPSYGQICKRINKLNINITKGNTDDDDYIIIAVDSTGIKVTNRGQWMSDKWSLGKKGYLKIHVAVNIRTKEILALEVTDEKIHDGKMMKKLVEDVVLKINQDKKKTRIKSLIGDGAYDSNENFRFLDEKRIKPVIQVKRNSVVATRNNKIRNKETTQQSKDFLKWKKKMKYGQRWMVETAFSSIKRMFGEYVMATKFQNMVKEMMIKVSLYNLFTKLV